MGACDMLRDIFVIFTCLFLSLFLVSADADRASPSSKNPCQEQTATKVRQAHPWTLKEHDTC